MANRSPYHTFSSGEDERRRASRYITQGTPVLIGWLHEGECRTVLSTLRNLSMRGALSEVESVPTPDDVLLIRLVNDDAAGKVKANIVGVIPPPRPRRFSRRREHEGFLLRLDFIGPCPYDFFKAAIAGFVVESHVVVPEFEGFDPRDWH